MADADENLLVRVPVLRNHGRRDAHDDEAGDSAPRKAARTPTRTDAAVASRPPTPRDEELVVEEPEYGAEDLAAVDAFMDDMGETAEDGTEDDMQSAREEESDGA